MFILVFVLLYGLKFYSNSSADLTLIVNIQNYNDEFYLNPKDLICEKNKKLLFISFVVIAPEYFEKRDLIRRTWGNNSLAPEDFKLIFSLGFSINSTVNNLIADEFKKHNDILQIKFNDSYNNLTTKIMKSFKWINYYCKNAQYVLRINDDVMANTFSLINYFKNIAYKKNQLYGHLLRRTQPIRFQHKHFVSKEQFARDFYPDYPEGFFKSLNSLI
jgi:hypothetical protein